MALTLQDIAGKISSSKAAKQPEEKMWDLNSRFLGGQQNLSFDRNLQSYTAGRETSNMPQINLLLPLYKTVMSKLSTSYPGIAVLPASPSTDDINKAKSTEMALRYFWKSEKIDRIISQIIEYLITFGNAAMLQYYDADKKSICVKAVSPFDIFYESGVARLEDAQWVAIRQYYTKEDLVELYPDFATMIEEYAANSTAAMTQNASAYTTQNYVPPNMVDVYEVYTKAGETCWIVGGEIIFSGKTPGNVYPVQHIKWTDIPNRLWGISMIGPLIELQSLYNKSRGMVMQNAALMANPKWLIPKQSGVAPNAITGAAGEKIFYSPAGGTPQQVAAAPIPAYVIDNIRQIQTEIMDVSGIHSSTLGKRAVGIVSGKAIESLAAQDTSSMQTTQSDIENACADMAKVVIMFMKEFYNEPKMYRMFDNLGGIIFAQIQSVDIVEDPEIFIQAGSLFQDNAQDREARAVQLLELGLITKEEAKHRIDSRASFDDIINSLKGSQHAIEMLNAVKQGAVIEVVATDDITAMTKVFNEFIGTPEYYQMPQERQDYMWDVLVSLSAPVGPEGDIALEEMKKNKKIFPRATNPMIAQRQIVGMSPTAASQVTQDALQVAEREKAVRSEIPEEAAVNEAISMGGIRGGRG